jgi:hypothetical protein
MEINILELIQYIVWLATERGEVLSPIRLVKFIYLVDLYNARKNAGLTLTGWKWKFVHYGPFCPESLSVIKKSVEQRFIDAINYESKFDDEEHFLYKYKDDTEPPIAAKLPFYITGPLQAATKKWASDTYGLLDHVYFETEPMIGAVPGDVLDFSKAKEPPKIQEVHMKELSKKKIAEGKQLIAKMKESLTKEICLKLEQPIYDDFYYDALYYLNGESLELQIEGKAKIEDSVEELD